METETLRMNMTKRAIRFGFWLGMASAVFGMKLLSAGSARPLLWPTPSAIESVLPGLDQADLVPLPAPALLPTLGLYTTGTRTALSWNRDTTLARLHGDLSHPGFTPAFYQVQAYNPAIPDSLWGFVDASAESAVIVYDKADAKMDAWEGERLRYRLRYWAINTAGAYGLSAWSDSLVSIQDWTPPSFRISIDRLNRSRAGNWIIDDIHIRLLAAKDTNGVVDSLLFRETFTMNGLTQSLDTVRAIDSDYTFGLLAPAHVPETLTLWVRDRSGQKSRDTTVVLFWLPGEEGEMFAFPNPFNPAVDPVTVIRIPVADYRSAKIFDPFGNLVRVLRKNGAEDQFFEWDGRNGKGDRVSNGGYLFVIDGNETLYCKIAILR
jgi:hypothetical protein